MFRFILIIIVVIGFIWLISYLIRLTKREKKEKEVLVEKIKKGKQTIYNIKENEMEIKGNAYQCPLFEGDYIFIHLFDAIEKGDKEKERLIRLYVNFNNLQVDSSELDRAKLKD